MIKEYIDDSPSNSPEDPCYDCGSTIPLRDTPLCDMAEEGSIKDLPAVPGTQWWTESKSVLRRQDKYK